MNQIRSGWIVGNGSAINIACGFIPDWVQLWNMTDGDIVNMSALAQVVPFTSGGTNELKKNTKCKGATSGATFRIKEVCTPLRSGSWAGGDASGFLIVEEVVGTIASENIYATDPATASGVDDATVTVNVTMGIKIDTAVATIASGSNPIPYAGSTSVPVGFTIPSGLSEDDKLFYWIAFRNAEGGDTKTTTS